MSSSLLLLQYTSFIPSRRLLGNFRFDKIAKARRLMMASSFPPSSVQEVVSEVASLLKQRKETVSIAETVRCSIFLC